MKRIWLGSVLLTLAAAGGVFAGGRGIFEPVPPVWQIEDAHVPEIPREIEFDPIEHAIKALFTRRIDNALALESPALAMDINSLDEVPDSAWFENRIGRRALTPEDVFWGPLARDGSSAPAAEDRLTVVQGKSEGANPGFIAQDSAGRRYLVKFDPPHRPEMQTAADVVGNRLLWALGYHVAEDSLFFFRREDLPIDPEATIRRPGGRKHKLTEQDLDRVFELVHRNDDGSYRVQLSRFVPGKPIGPFLQTGVRKDDPNDHIPHQERRSLRGLLVFAAWLNHTDIKPGNTVDSYVTENGKSFVRHFLVDLGEIFAGRAGESGVMESGFEYGFDPRAMLTSLLTLGLTIKPWERVKESGYRGIGPFGAEPFTFKGWKPSMPNRMFERADKLDHFWAVRKLLTLRPEHIAAAIRAGHYTDPAAARYLQEVLEKRRETIALEVLQSVNPAFDFRVGDGARFEFGDLALRHGLADVAASSWRVQHVVRSAVAERRFEAFEVHEPTLDLVQTLQPGEQLVIRIETLRSGKPIGEATHVHLVHDGTWRIIGIDRWRTGKIDA